MWISKKKWAELVKRISALEQAEQERRTREERIKRNDDSAIEKARALLNMI